MSGVQSLSGFRSRLMYGDLLPTIILQLYLDNLGETSGVVAVPWRRVFWAANRLPLLLTLYSQSLSAGRFVSR